MVFVKKNGRTPFRSNRRSNYSRNSNSNKPRLRGSISQLHEKYIKLAKEVSSEDRIQAEYYNQFADHYARLMAEHGFKSFTYEKENDSLNKNVEDVQIQKNEKINLKDSSDVKKNEPSVENDTINEIENSENSIEAIPFLAKTEKKTLKSKK